MEERARNGYSRRDFLKIVGATGGVAAAGCSKSPVEKLIPYVVQPDDVIPGVANWYAGACSDCSAGCGTLVRNRDGRAVKLEGNPQHPINRGALCAQGQSAIQAHYDPDRIREPLKRDANGTFKTVAWPDAVKEVADTLTGLAADEEAILLTGEVSGSTQTLITEFTKAFPKLKHMTFELFGRDTVDRAAAIAFGPNVRPIYNLQTAEVIVSFGADFLETWNSPVELSRQWGDRRRPNDAGEISYFVHFEPRLSLTAANADRWVMNRPGTEASLLLALTKLVYDKTSGGRLSGAVKGSVGKLVANADVAKIAQEADVDPKILELVATRLIGAKPSVVLAGGASTTGENDLTAALLANVLNSMLGNLGSTVYLVPNKKGTSETSSYEQLVKTLDEIGAGTRKVKLLMISGINPQYLLPAKAGFGRAIGKIGTVVSVSMALDETTSFANIVLPRSSGLETWWDSEPRPGIYNLNQPAMQPLYATQSLGDTLLSIAAQAKVIFRESSSFLDYMKECWKERTGEANFESRWLTYVEQGGDYEGYRLTHTSADLRDVAANVTVAASKVDGLQLLAFPTVLSADGTTANRPWMQETPEPMSSVVWGSYVEMHPDTAKKLGFEMKDVVTVRTPNGVIDAPLFVSKYIHRDLVAVPIGQGHTEYGRYAVGVGENVLSVMESAPARGSFGLRVGPVTVESSITKEELAIIQWQNDQLERGIVRNVTHEELAHKLHAKDAHGHDAHHGEHNLAEAHDFTDMEHRPQMYKQMDHPLYRWGMSIDLTKCTGCSACVVACYAENNIALTGKETVLRGRVMSWIRMDRYFDGPDHRPVSGFQPMMCQHCGNAPCEPVCPVYATYHNEEGLNSMVYNRCVGTRYCSNNCSYKVRRFNWFRMTWPEPITWQLNPDVTVREVGVMEKCTYCVQRIREVQNRAKNQGRAVEDGEIQPACASTCPTSAITFGNLKDKTSQVSKLQEDPRAYKVLDAVINTQPGTSYLSRVVHADQV